MTNKNNFYRINGKTYNYVNGYDTPYSYIYVYKCTETGEKFCIEEQTNEDLEDERKAWDIE